MSTTFYRVCPSCVAKVEHYHAVGNVVAHRYNGGGNAGVQLAIKKILREEPETLLVSESDREMITVEELEKQGRVRYV